MSTPELGDLTEALELRPAAISVSDVTAPDSPLVFVNNEFSRLTGYSKEECLGRNCRFLQGSDVDPESRSLIRKSISDREDVSICLKNYRKDGTAFHNLLVLTYFDFEQRKSMALGCQYDFGIHNTSDTAVTHLASVHGLVKLMQSDAKLRFRQRLDALHMRAESVQMLVDLYMQRARFGLTQLRFSTDGSPG